MRYIICILLLFLLGSGFAQLPTGGLVAHYPFNNDAADQSGNSNNGTIAGGVSAGEDRFGNPCGAMRFNGTDGYITVPNSVSLKSPISSLSITGWFKIEVEKNSPGNVNLILFSKSGTPDKAQAKAQYRFTLTRSFGDTRSSISLGSDISANDENYNAHPIEPGQWYFLTVVYEENWMNVFLNEKLVAQSIVKKPFTPNDFNLEIGRDISGSAKYFNGCLDDLRIYNRGLSPFEVSSLFNYKPGAGIMENLAITFPKNIEKIADAGKCYTAVRFAEPVASTDCGKVELKQVAGLSAGSLFAAGQHTIAYEATLASGKKIVDSFQIIVADKEPPIIKCPADTVASVTGSGKGAPVDYSLPDATDNCKNAEVELVSGPASGSLFSDGTTTVTYKATDDWGNSSECSFKVKVIKTVQRTLRCTQDITAYTKADAENAVINFEKPYVEIGGVKTVMKRIKGFSSGSLYPVGKTEVIYELQDTVRGNMVCSFNVTVRDTIPPAITCPADIKKICEAGQKTAVANYLLPKATDSGFGVSVKLLSGYITGSGFPVGVTLVTYEAEDESGNKSQCSFKVIVEEKKAPEVKPVVIEKVEVKVEKEKPVPVPVEIVEEKIKQVQKPYTPPVVEQKPKPVEKPAEIIPADAKSKIREAEKAFFHEPIEKDEAPKHEEKPVIVVKEEVKKDIVKEIEKVVPPPVKVIPKEEVVVKAPPVAEKKIEESKPIDVAPKKPEPPLKPIVINCGENIIKRNDPGKCGGAVNYNLPEIISGNEVKITQTKGTGSGKFFKTGTTVNAFSATDVSGYIKECSFNVTVRDQELPVFDCPSDTTIILPANRRGFIYYYSDPAVRDNCGVDSLIQQAGSKNGCFLEVGVHPFIYKAMDASGNYQMCTHSVIIKTGAPAVRMDPPKSIDAELNLGSDSVHYEYKAEVNDCFLTVFIYDDGEEDNDTVSIIFNGQVIVNRDMIRLKENRMIKRNLVLDGGNENYIIAKAWNKGKYGLNTLRIDVYEGNIENEKKELKDKKPAMSKVLHSKPGIAGGMILKCRE